jgi:hypothetical protein
MTLTDNPSVAVCSIDRHQHTEAVGSCTAEIASSLHEDRIAIPDNTELIPSFAALFNASIRPRR